MITSSNLLHFTLWGSWLFTSFQKPLRFSTSSLYLAKVLNPVSRLCSHMHKLYFSTLCSLLPNSESLISILISIPLTLGKFTCFISDSAPLEHNYFLFSRSSILKSGLCCNIICCPRGMIKQTLRKVNTVLKSKYLCIIFKHEKRDCF